MGFRSGAGVLAWLAVAGILIVFTLALTWIAVIPGLSAKSADGASAFAYPLIFLPFISSAFVATDTMPGPVRAFAEDQPVTSIVNTIRDRFRSAAGQGRHLDRPRLVCRHPDRRVRPRHGHLSRQDHLSRRASQRTRFG
jgi:ABC-type polysaccharide/polyol phosphate export permease